MRRWLAFQGVLVAATAVALPAQAKCMPGEDGCPTVVKAVATIEGPGLGAPIVVRDDDFWDLARLSGLTAYHGSYAAVTEPSGGVPVGPRYEIRYRLVLDDGTRLRVVQLLFPYEPNPVIAGRLTAWTLTNEGQTFIETYDQAGVVLGGPFPRSKVGWWKSTALRQLLLSMGFPEESPVPPAGPVGTAGQVAEAVAAEPPDEPGARTWITLAALIALIAIGALAGRPHRGRIAA